MHEPVCYSIDLIYHSEPQAGTRSSPRTISNGNNWIGPTRAERPLWQATMSTGGPRPQTRDTSAFVDRHRCGG
jgi:hypothetical protein